MVVFWLRFCYLGNCYQTHKDCIGYDRSLQHCLLIKNTKTIVMKRYNYRMCFTANKNSITTTLSCQRLLGFFNKVYSNLVCRHFKQEEQKNRINITHRVFRNDYFHTIQHQVGDLEPTVIIFRSCKNQPILL